MKCYNKLEIDCNPSACCQIAKASYTLEDMDERDPNDNLHETDKKTSNFYESGRWNSTSKGVGQVGKSFILRRIPGKQRMSLIDVYMLKRVINFNILVYRFHQKFISRPAFISEIECSIHEFFFDSTNYVNGMSSIYDSF